jgi:hypothetical protein
VSIRGQPVGRPAAMAARASLVLAVSACLLAVACAQVAWVRTSLPADRALSVRAAQRDPKGWEEVAAGYRPTDDSVVLHVLKLPPRPAFELSAKVRCVHGQPRP